MNKLRTNKFSTSIFYRELSYKVILVRAGSVTHRQRLIQKQIQRQSKEIQREKRVKYISSNMVIMPSLGDDSP
jgi:hypothetical protein